MHCFKIMEIGWNSVVQMSKSQQKRVLLRLGGVRRTILSAAGMVLKRDFVDGLECIYHHSWRPLDLQSLHMKQKAIR